MRESYLQTAALAWCTPKTRGIEMDHRLAFAFAQILEDEEKRIRAELRAKAEVQQLPILPDKGPWKIVDANHIGSDDFTHDVWLEVTGDFGGDEPRRVYMQWLCSILNGPKAEVQAVPFEIADYLSSYEWRSEGNGVFELTDRDRELLQDFVNGLPLYTAPPAQAVSVPMDTLEVRLTVGRLTISKQMPLVQATTSSVNEPSRYAEQCWRELAIELAAAPSPEPAE